MLSLKRYPGGWWTSRAGRKTAYYVAGFAIVAAPVLTLLPHTELKEWNVKHLHVYRLGDKKKLTEATTKKFERCLDLLDIDSFTRKFIAPFQVVGLELYSLGSSQFRSGASIGIPANFDYESVKDVDKAKIQINNSRVDWGTEAGESFAHSLVLPEKAQLFGICREILSTSNYKHYLHTAYSPLPFMFVYFTAQYINKKYDFFSRPRLFRYTYYTLLTLFSGGAYFLLRDYTNVQYELSDDKRLADMGSEMIEGGIEYYDKLIQRNIAIRELTGDSGKMKFSRTGNLNSIMRYKTVPLTVKKKYLESRLRDIKATNTTEFEDKDNK